MRIHTKELLVLALLISPQANAIELNNTTQIHGFLSQAAVYSPDNPYAGTDADNGSVKFREIGLNGYSELTPDFRLAGQILSRQRDESDDGDVRVDFLLADYLVWSDHSSSFGLRAGRVKNTIGFYNSIRDIPSARPGYNVPDSIYFDAFRDSLLSTDGINLYGTALLDNNQLTWELTAGRKDVKSEDFEYFAFGYPVRKGEADDAPIYLLNVNFVPDILNNDLRLGISLVDTEIELENTQSVAEAQMALMTAPPGDALTNPHLYVTGAKIEALYATFSAQYNYKNWIFTSEYLHLNAKFMGEFAGMPANNRQKSHGYYFQVEWLSTPNTTWLARYEELDLGTNGSEINYNPHRDYGKGWTVGGRWMFADNWSITGQASFNEGTAWLPSYRGIEEKQLQKYWNYYVLSLSYQF
ncbi:hypothetical protein [Marinobacter sp.]|uniref:hypothetical protein n=1 Tax=Marinobacter sp. TaxID=50741 RepID=UPI002B268789|nr:hypothetical protein [Marinobacter sp.]